MFPIRCYTCNSMLAQLQCSYTHRVTTGEDPAVILDSMGVGMMCCRRMFLGYVDMTSCMLIHPRLDVDLDKSGSRLFKEVHFERDVCTD